MTARDDIQDLLIVGGGVNGCGVARDAAGQGFSVTLVEMADLGSGTSSASTKLFHGGLRYLEYFKFRLVRESLIEREILLRAMPHISWPMRFVLPYSADMRFENDTPTSKVLNMIMPWMRGRRPAWLIRLGLFLYDTLGGRKILPGTKTLDLTTAPEGIPLQDRFAKAYEYSDCWVEDSRLVILNARAAQAKGAVILPRTKLIDAQQEDGIWQITLEDTQSGAKTTQRARMIVNAGGPWVENILRQRVHAKSDDGVRLVRGSHIVTRRLFDHDKCYFFQGTDGRILFAIPYENDFTLIGTTDRDHDDPDVPPVCTDSERDYMIDFINGYLKDKISVDDIVWSYSGVRPLFDDAATSASAATRDYTLKVDNSVGAPMLNIFGGKITTYRRLAEHALEDIAATLGRTSRSWTAAVPLPGGDFAVDGVADLIAGLTQDYPFLSEPWARRLIRAYGTDARKILGGSKTVNDLGDDFGATLTAAEVDWLIDKEFARTGDDILWRRSKLGLRLSNEQTAQLDTYITKHTARETTRAAMSRQ